MKTFSEFLANLDKDRQASVAQLRSTIVDSIPVGFVEQVSEQGIAFVIPHSLYADGYHCDPNAALPFINVISQKNFIGFYHIGMYADPNLSAWFINAYPKHCRYKLDMGKSCVRFKKLNDIPFSLIAELVQKMSVQDWISIYEAAVKR